VRVELEDQPRGKGRAVRRGLDLASGDLILIQDADLEYDIDDYDSLLEPLLTWERAFVLGSRHTGIWKIRKFTDRLGTAAIMNVGHLCFATALNVLYLQRLRDPFTMFKVSAGTAFTASSSNATASTSTSSLSSSCSGRVTVRSSSR